MAWCHMWMRMMTTWRFEMGIFQSISFYNIKVKDWLIVFNILVEKVMATLNLT